jgi:hypothetical protein
MSLFFQTAHFYLHGLVMMMMMMMKVVVVVVVMGGGFDDEKKLSEHILEFVGFLISVFC